MTKSDQAVLKNLRQAFPELRAWICALEAHWSGDTPGAHISCGDLLDPYVLMIVLCRYDSGAVSRVANFTEWLAEKRPDVISTTMVPFLIRRSVMKPAWAFFGPKARELAVARLFHHQSRDSILQPESYEIAWRSALSPQILRQISFDELIDMRDALADRFNLSKFPKRSQYDQAMRVDASRYRAVINRVGGFEAILAIDDMTNLYSTVERIESDFTGLASD